MMDKYLKKGLQEFGEAIIYTWWNIWKGRNKKIFHNEALSISTKSQNQFQEDKIRQQRLMLL